MASVRRILRELKNLSKEPIPNISIRVPDVKNNYHWIATIKGPPDTQYVGKSFDVDIIFTEEYPNKAPSLRFVSNIYHLNVHDNGNVCLNILTDEWSMASQVQDILLSLYNLLVEPNEDDPANPEILDEYRNNRKEYDRKAKEKK